MATYRRAIVAVGPPGPAGLVITATVVRDARAVLRLVEQLQAAGCTAAVGRRGRWYVVTAERAGASTCIGFRRPDGWWVASQPGAGVDAWQYALPVDAELAAVRERVESELGETAGQGAS